MFLRDVQNLAMRGSETRRQRPIPGNLGILDKWSSIHRNSDTDSNFLMTDSSFDLEYKAQPVAPCPLWESILPMRIAIRFQRYSV